NDPAFRSSVKSRGQSGIKPAGPSSLGNGPATAGPIVKPRSTPADGGIPPLIRPGAGPGATGPQGPGLIAIGGPPTTPVNPGVHTDPFAFWMSYYKTHDESAGELAKTVHLLLQARRTRDVEAVLRGYLWNLGRKSPEAWMYRALAMAIRIN